MMLIYYSIARPAPYAQGILYSVGFYSAYEAPGEGPAAGKGKIFLFLWIMICVPSPP